MVGDDCVLHGCSAEADRDRPVISPGLEGEPATERESDRMFEALAVAREAMREVVREFSLSAAVEQWEFEEVLQLNARLSRNAQGILDLRLMETAANDDAIGHTRNLATFFQATERLLGRMFKTAVSKPGAGRARLAG
jgi:hypothetical protein